MKMNFSTTNPVELKVGDNNTTLLQEENDELAKPKMTPAMMLLSHNKVIENMQVLIENLNNRIEEQ